MSKARITKRFVEALPYADKGQITYTDSELAGFGIFSSFILGYGDIKNYKI